MASEEVEILDDSEDKTLAASDTTMRSTLRSTMYKYIVGERSNLISPLQLLHDVDTIIDAVQQLPGARLKHHNCQGCTDTGLGSVQRRW